MFICIVEQQARGGGGGGGGGEALQAAGKLCAGKEAWQNQEQVCAHVSVLKAELDVLATPTVKRRGRQSHRGDGWSNKPSAEPELTAFKTQFKTYSVS